MPPERIPRVAHVLALAHNWRGLIRDGTVRNRAELSRPVGVSRARVSQVMRLLDLAPDIQEAVLDGQASGPGADWPRERLLPLVESMVRESVEGISLKLVLSSDGTYTLSGKLPEGELAMRGRWSRKGRRIALKKMFEAGKRVPHSLDVEALWQPGRVSFGRGWWWSAPTLLRKQP